MKIAKEIFARIWAFWGLVTFIVTFSIIFIPSMFSHFYKDEKKGQDYFIRISKVWMSFWLFLVGCSVKIKGKENFKKSIEDPETIINTLRLNDPNGEIVGFSKGGPLEKYQLREEIRDENFGLKNTIFLEPLALKMGYWGLRGGSEMRHMFIMQAHSMKYKYMTSFALRDVIKARIDKEDAEFVQQFDPERWDYYRVKL